MLTDGIKARQAVAFIAIYNAWKFTLCVWRWPCAVFLVHVVV